MDDKRKYTPSLATVKKESKKEALDDKLAKALDNSQLDRAIARVTPKLREGEDPLFYDVSRRLSSPSLTGVTPVDEVVQHPTRESATGTDDADDDPTAPGSPWTKVAGERDVDNDALPSAHLPPAAPPTFASGSTSARWQLPPWVLAGLSPRLLSILALFAVLAPVTVVLMVSKTSPGTDKAGVASSVPATSAPPPGSAAGPTARATSASAAPAPATTAPVVADGGASLPVQPAPSSAPSPDHRAPAHGLHMPDASDDPYSAPSPPATVAPAPPPTATPTATPSAKVPSDLY